jgi:hypothetical protein
MSVPRLLIFNKVQEQKIYPLSPFYSETVEDVIIKELDLSRETISAETMKSVSVAATYFTQKIKKMWRKSYGIYHRVLEQNETFFEMNMDVVIMEPRIHLPPDRPSKSFTEKGKTQKYHAAAKVRDTAEPDAVLLAASVIHREQGHGDAAFVSRKIAVQPVEAGAMAKAAFLPVTLAVPVSTEEALGHLLSENLSVRQYINNRRLLIDHNVKVG